jgi:hypothetical protein
MGGYMSLRSHLDALRRVTSLVPTKNRTILRLSSSQPRYYTVCAISTPEYVDDFELLILKERKDPVVINFDTLTPEFTWDWGKPRKNLPS